MQNIYTVVGLYCIEMSRKNKNAKVQILKKANTHGHKASKPSVCGYFTSI